MMHHRPGNAGAWDRSDRAGRRAEKIVCLSGRLGYLAKRFLGERRGNIAVTFALSIAVVFGAVGLGTSAASWYSQKRDIQNAADLAAASAINSLKASFGGAQATIETYAYNEARSSTAWHGFTNGSSGVTVTPITPPSTGAYTAASYRDSAVEVTVTQPAPLGFASLFMSSGPTIAARAVAMFDYSAGDCLLALNPTAAKAFNMQGNATVNVACGIAVNSSANGPAAKDEALYVQGSVHATSTSITVAGGIGQTGGATATSSNISHATTPDPYAGFNALPTGPNQGSFSDSPSSTNTLQPGIYSSITVNGTATLSPGTYFVSGGDFTLGGHLSGTGVTIVLTNSTGLAGGGSVGTFQMGNNATAAISAPQTGTNAGKVIVQSSVATQDVLASSNGSCSGNCSVLQGGPGTSIVGVVYFLNGNLTYQGTPSGTNTGCTQIVADTLAWAGNPSLYVNACNNTGVTQFGPSTVAMVE